MVCNYKEKNLNMPVYCADTALLELRAIVRQELGQWDKKSEAAHTSSFQEEFEEEIIVLAYRASHGITVDSGP